MARDNRGHSPRTSTAATRGRRRSSYDEARDRSRGTGPRRRLPLPAWLAALFVVVAVRLFWLQVVDAPNLSAKAAAIHTNSVTISARRGTIYDRNGVVLATSVETTTVVVDPTVVENVDATTRVLADVLGGDPRDYREACTAPDTRYSLIKRKADLNTGNQLKERVAEVTGEGGEYEGVALGIYFKKEWNREYPNGQVAGQIVGACRFDSDADRNIETCTGISGLEYYYNDILSGEAGYYEAEYGASGEAIPGATHDDKPVVDGQDIVISIDIELQQAVEDRLIKGVNETGGTSGNAIVMDGGTGEIYAAASLPLFNPADRSTVAEGSTQLKSVTDLFEPGSIFKTVSALSVLETDTMGPEDTLFSPATLSADGFTISDAHERGDATYSLRQILDQSSNVGISLAVEKMGFQQLYDHIKTFNLNEASGVDYPGEQVGYLVPFDEWSRVTGYNVSFGQGISLTPLQITRFYGALVNDGVECTPHFLISNPTTGETPEWPTEDVVDKKDELPVIQDMLRTVVTEGTGTGAAIEGYDVAGKTSTAEIYDEENGGYRDSVYNIAFTGFLANSSSQLVCFVGSNEVTSYALSVAPVFKDIMTTAIDRFKISAE